MGDRLPQALEVARQVSRYGGLCVVLIHPNILDHKLAFEKGFVEGVRPYAGSAPSHSLDSGGRTQQCAGGRGESWPAYVVKLEIPRLCQASHSRCMRDGHSTVVDPIPYPLIKPAGS